MKAFVCILMGCLCSYLPAMSSETRPNILFIAVDDLNDWIGCMGGNPNTQTPNIDRLAKRGLLFTNAQCAAPSCVPSRSALMTGKQPAETGLYENLNQSFRAHPDLKKLVTIPQYFSHHGYHTMGVGKILHNPNPLDYDELHPVTYWMNPEPKAMPGDTLAVTHTKLWNAWAPVDVEVSEMTDWKMATWAAEQLKRKHDKPFFLACGIFRPHLPWNVPPKYYEKFPLENLTLPKVKPDDLSDVGAPAQKPQAIATRIMADENLWRRAVQAYLANINFADECVGVLLDALDASPYKDNTIVILWSDHGWHLGEKSRWQKFTLWEESARCVLMCAGPGIPQAKSCAQPVNLIDIYPTLLDLCQLPSKEGLSGSSFMAQIKDPSHGRPRGSLTANELGFSLRTSQWRYILYRDGSEELYDHQQDPMEWTNLADQPKYTKIKAKLRAQIPAQPAKPRNK